MTRKSPGGNCSTRSAFRAAKITASSTGLILNHALESHAGKLGLAVTNLSPSEKIDGLLPGYKINFLMFAVAYLIAVVLWLCVDSTKPVIAEKE